MIDFRDVKYQPRDILFIADKQVHQFRVHSDTKGYITPFTQEFLYHNESDQNILQNYRLFDYSLNSPKISLSQESFNRLEWLFDELFSEHDRSAKSELQSEITRSLLKTILLTAEREKRKMFSHAEHNLNYPDFVKFKSSLERNFCFTRNVSDYSRMLGISSQKLNQLTKKILNQTAKTFIDERVIIEAKRLLAHTNLSAKEISEAVGFDEPTNFNKYFKRHTKQTPRSFRQIQKS